MGGTLMVSRSVNNQSHYKMKLEELGFPDVTVTALESDALDFLIRDLQPDLLMMAARFYERSTPFMMGRLKRRFPKIKMAALSLENYPPEIAMWFSFNGIKSYDTAFDGFEQFYEGLEIIRKGRDYISPSVQERIDLRDVKPEPADDYTARQEEVMHLICGGWKDEEIAHNLHISRRTVDTHKTEIFTMLNVRNATELIGVALKLGIVKLDEIVFYPRDLIVNPKPPKEKKKKTDKKKTITGGKIYDFKN
jgi:DNA-binding NarL/FixJ family response regulator